MKKCILFLLLGGFCLPVSAQSYHPLVRTGVYWDEASQTNGAFCYTSVNRLEFLDGDSTVGNHAYRLMNIYPFLGTPVGQSLCPPYTVSPVPYRAAFLREDVDARKVFMLLNFSGPVDELLYDFSLEPGDTLLSDYATGGSPLILDHVADTTLHNGEVRKVFCFDPECWIHYIESIGGWQGLAEPLIVLLGGSSETLCVKEGTLPVWGYACGTQFVGAGEHAPETFRVGPNPATGRLVIESGNGMPFPADAEIRLCDLTGKTVRTAHLTTGQTSLAVDLAGLAPGIYLCLIDCGAARVREKVVVCAP